MRNLIVIAALCFAFSTSAMALTTQQELMQSCNTTAQGKKGDERKAHMKACLSDGKKAQQAPAMTTSCAFGCWTGVGAVSVTGQTWTVPLSCRQRTRERMFLASL